MNTQQEKQCPICYDKIVQNNFVVTACDHIFCLTCLLKYHNHKKHEENNDLKCPMCRTNLLPKPKVKVPTQRNTYFEPNTYLDYVFNPMNYQVNVGADNSLIFQSME